MAACGNKRPLESRVQRSVIKRLEDKGYLVVKVGLCNKAGFPDLMGLKDGRAVFVEVKRPGNKPRPLQEYRIDELQRAGFTAIVVTCAGDVDSLL